MPKFSVTIPHALTKDEAVERLGHFSEKVQAHYKDTIKDFQQSWDGDVSKFSFRTFGMNINGQIHIDSPEVKLDGELPFAAMMLTKLLA